VYLVHTYRMLPGRCSAAGGGEGAEREPAREVPDERRRAIERQRPRRHGLAPRGPAGPDPQELTDLGGDPQVYGEALVWSFDGFDLDF
jgi:hypothetical protein